MNRSLILLGLLILMAFYNLQAQVPDNSFGTNGIVVRPGQAEINAVTTQPDGKIITAGYAYENTRYHFQIARYNNNGNLDNTFGTNGIVNTEISFSSKAKALVIQTDGKIVVAGTYYTGDFANIYHAAIVRYTMDGTIDSTFGINGIIMDELGFSESVSDIIVQPDGKILIGGAITSINQIAIEHFMLARYNTNGSLDTNFGSNGMVKTVIGPNSVIADITLQPDGKIIAAGREGIYSLLAPPDEIRFALARYDNLGNLDNSFGSNGIALTNVINGTPDAITSIIMQPDGKIVAGGSWGDSVALVRYEVNGDLDNSFGANGKTIHPGSQTRNLQLALAANGTIVSASTMTYDIEDGGDFLLSGYLPNGSIDSTFGTNGRTITNLGDTPTDFADCLTVQSDGKIIVGGSSNGSAALVRYTTGGSTAINDVALQENEIQLYPNPFIDVIHLTLNSTKGVGEIKLDLTNVLGQIMYTSQLKLKQGNNTIALPNVAAGNYILSITTETGNNWSRKITKN